MSLGPVAVAMPVAGASVSVAPAAVAAPSSPKAELGREVLRAALAACMLHGGSTASAAAAEERSCSQAQQRSTSPCARGASAFVAQQRSTSPCARGASAFVVAAAPPVTVAATSSRPATLPKAYAEPVPVCPPSPKQTTALPGVSVRVAPAERVGLSVTVAVPDKLPPTALATADDVTPKGASVVALAPKDNMVAEAQKIQQEFSALAAGGSPGNRAYLERLSKAAAEAAAKGYGVKRMTHTVRRTRVRKTTNTTDLRTMETETNTQEQATVDSWMEEGSPTLSGVGVMCARGTRVVDRYSDGTEQVQDAQVKGGCMFWLGGDSSSVQSTTFNHHFGSGNCRGDARARWAGSSPPMARIAAA